LIEIGRLTVPCLLCGHPATVTAERPPEILRAGALTIRTVECSNCSFTTDTP
jgi:C4-type Zn-finger protein